MDNFTEIRWGISREELLSIEKSKLIKDNIDEVIYEAAMFDKTINVKYIFYENELVRMIYSLMNRRDILDDYIDDYDDFKSLLTMICGKPAMDERLYDEETNASLHLALWHMSFGSMSCILSIDNAGVSCYIEHELSNSREPTTVHIKSISFNQ